VPHAEPYATAIILVAFGVLLAVSVAFSRGAARLGVPLALVFLLVGVLAGSEGIGRIPFEDYHVTFRLGTAALVFILFDGGLNTPAADLRRVLAPATTLATVGVIATAGATAAAAHWFGLEWSAALLFGAIVSSNDAAAVFSVLSASGTRLALKVEATLEVESGLNDPMAVILTTALTANALHPGTMGVWRIAGDVVLEMAVGGVVGWALGRGARWVMARMELPAGGLYPAFTLGLACIAYGLPTLVHGSGFLSVYVAGVVLGSGTLAHRVSIRRVHDALGWLSQIAMFLLLGLLVFPSRLGNVWWMGLLLALFLAFIARPVVVALCLLPFKYRWRERAYIGWVGLRGAVPIVLATIPVMAGASRSRDLFDLVFFVVVVGAIVPGATVPWMARRLRVESREPPEPRAMIEIDAPSSMGTDMRVYHVDRALAVAGARLSEIPFPSGAAVSVIERGGQISAPNGQTVLQPGDNVYIVARTDDRAELELLFGGPRDED
jgi:cell volume regulation protein A